MAPSTLQADNLKFLDSIKVFDGLNQKQKVLFGAREHKVFESQISACNLSARFRPACLKLGLGRVMPSYAACETLSSVCKLVSRRSASGNHRRIASIGSMMASNTDTAGRASSGCRRLKICWWWWWWFSGAGAKVDCGCSCRMV